MNWPPLIVTVAPNGASRTKSDHPALPISPRELAETAAACLDGGAAMIHLHVRTRDGRHTLDPAAYRDATAAIRRAVGDEMVVQVTSESGGLYRPEEQMRAVREVRPEGVSLALRELVPDADAEQPAAQHFQWLADNGCTPQYILFTGAEVDWYHGLLRRGVIPHSPHWVLFVLGRYTEDRQSRPADLLPFLSEPPRAPWSMCAFGRAEHACAAAATALGGHVRVGFENNVHLKDGSTAGGNAELVRQVKGVADAVNRPLMDAEGIRRLFAP